MTIKINNSEWEVKEVPTNDSSLIVNSRRCRGTCDYLPQIISLDATLSRDNKYCAFIHELSHAFLYQTQIKNHNKFDEEMLCEFMGIYAKDIVSIADEYFKESVK